MGNKVRIWNQEVSNCSQCPLCISLIILTTRDCYYCNDLKVVMNGNDADSEIHKDCPFTKFITKEVIEGFGFKYTGGQMIANGRQDYEGIFPILGLLHLSYKPTNKKIIIKHPNYIRDGSGKFENYINLFEGTINNPEELKFILKSLNIIE